MKKIYLDNDMIILLTNTKKYLIKDKKFTEIENFQEKNENVEFNLLGNIFSMKKIKSPIENILKKLEKNGKIKDKFLIRSENILYYSVRNKKFKVDIKGHKKEIKYKVEDNYLEEYDANDNLVRTYKLNAGEKTVSELQEKEKRNVNLKRKQKFNLKN